MTHTKTLFALIATGSALVLGAVWWLALGIGLLVWVWRPAATVSKIVFTLDTTTGEMKAQPQDKAAEDYLKTRDK